MKLASLALASAALFGLSLSASAQTISSVSPITVPAVVNDGAAQITVIGTDFAGDTRITVDGLLVENPPVPAPANFSVAPTKIMFNMPKVSKLGLVDVQLTGTGPNYPIDFKVRVQANTPPLLDLKASDPGFLLSGIPAEVTVSGLPGDFAVLFMSPDLEPTPLTGIVEGGLAIGDNGASLIRLQQFVIPPKGYVVLNFNLQSMPVGSTTHLQAIHLFQANLHNLPATPSNVETGVILF